MLCTVLPEKLGADFSIGKIQENNFVSTPKINELNKPFFMHAQYRDLYLMTLNPESIGEHWLLKEAWTFYRLFYFC